MTSDKQKIRIVIALQRMAAILSACLSLAVCFISFLLLFLNVPSDGTCAKHCCGRAVKAAYEELGLVLEQVECMLVVTLLYRFHDQVACFCQSAEEYESLGRRECREVRTCFTQHVAGEVIDFLCQFVAFSGCNRYVKGCDFLRFHIA